MNIFAPLTKTTLTPLYPIIMKRFIIFIIPLFSLLTLTSSNKTHYPHSSLLSPLSSFEIPSPQQKSSTVARQMEAQGLVNIKTVEPSIRVSLMYARADNFTGRILYGDLREAYLHPEAAEALAKAQRRLQQLRPDLSLIIFDAARPMSIQQRMWDVVKGTPKHIYVSNPKNGGGLHNYGLAVDISICRLNGDTITMGTKVDAMTTASHIDNEPLLVSQKRISKEAMENRRLLREAMQYGGYKPLRTEWWHFNLRTRAEAKARYKVIK